MTKENSMNISVKSIAQSCEFNVEDRCEERGNMGQVENIVQKNEGKEAEEYEKIPLTQKRLLDIKEFQQYTSLGRNRAAQLARESGAAFRFGRRVLIDRVKFDMWCDAR